MAGDDANGGRIGRLMHRLKRGLHKHDEAKSGDFASFILF